MSEWRKILREHVLPTIHDNAWIECIEHATAEGSASGGVHLAVFIEPYLSYILAGKKTIESRFSVNRHAPYGLVSSGDLLLLKKSGGPIVGLCLLSQVWFYNLTPPSLNALRKEFTDALCAQDPQFWKQREQAAFATLMQIESVLSIEPVLFPKRDRRGWVVLQTSIDHKLGATAT